MRAYARPTPEGQEMPLFGEALAADVERRYGSPVEMMQLRNGIFDESDVSVIATGTVKRSAASQGRLLTSVGSARTSRSAPCARSLSKRMTGSAGY